MDVDDEQKDAARGFDPRYDPAFQRGYRPQPGERPRTRMRAAPTPTVAPVERRREQVVREPVAREESEAEFFAEPVAPAPALASAPASAAPEQPQPTLPTPTTLAASILDRLDLSPRRNPLMLALWLVAGGFVVLGIVLYCVSVSLSYSGATPSGDVGALVVSQLGWMLAGPLITIGLATLVALLFLTALAGRRRPVETEQAGEDEGY